MNKRQSLEKDEVDPVIKHHAMKTNRRAEVELHLFLTLPLDGPYHTQNIFLLTFLNFSLAFYFVCFFSFECDLEPKS
jgi:hypothetical protein